LCDKILQTEVDGSGDSKGGAGWAMAPQIFA